MDAVRLSPTRKAIIDAADDLFYRQGYEHTSFANIAAAVKISRGNFYHHFKTKDEILEAVIERRLSDRQTMLEQWEQAGRSPRERIGRFINILVVNRDKIEQYGCPIGTLSGELGKLNHPASGQANHLFTLFRHWLRQQFIELGAGSRADALAMHLLARSQGIATLMNAFKEDRFARHELKLLNDWLNNLDLASANKT